MRYFTVLFLSMAVISGLLVSCNQPSASVESQTSRSHISGLINDWHQAATVADDSAFFGFMDDSCIYIGTDPAEKWYRDELRKWSAFAFERDTAWAFKPLKRSVYLSPDGNCAWFDEQLSTWMGLCDGSGVLINKAGEWKLMHYQLSVTVKNEKIKDFMSISPN